MGVGITRDLSNTFYTLESRRIIITLLLYRFRQKKIVFTRARAHYAIFSFFTNRCDFSLLHENTIHPSVLLSRHVVILSYAGAINTNSQHSAFFGIQGRDGTPISIRSVPSLRSVVAYLLRTRRTPLNVTAFPAIPIGRSGLDRVRLNRKTIGV